MYLVKRFEVDCWTTLQHRQTDGDRLPSLGLAIISGQATRPTKGIYEIASITSTSDHKNAISLHDETIMPDSV